MQVLRRFRNNMFLNMKHILRVNKVYFNINEDNESKNTTHQEQQQQEECVPSEDKSETENTIGNFDIIEENCHWIKPRQDGEVDPTFGGCYYHYRLYHKYTYLDIMQHLTACRQPQPSINKKLIKK